MAGVGVGEGSGAGVALTVAFGPETVGRVVGSASQGAMVGGGVGSAVGAPSTGRRRGLAPTLARQASSRPSVSKPYTSSRASS